ncbi:hypothetical protein BH09ACT11_BH09ACT11_00640 [soil metagenome]
MVAAGFVMALAGAVATGVSWDEPAHVIRLDNYLESGQYSVPWKDDLRQETEDRYTYGPVAMLILHGVEVAASGSTEVQITSDAYAARHVGVALLGLIGMAAVGWLCRLLIGTWRWGVLGMAILMAMPAWTGSLMFNVKDVPVATGLTIVTLALVLSAEPGSRRRWVADAALLWAGVVLALGTRPGVWPLIMAQVCLWALVTGRLVGWQRLAAVSAALSTAYLFLVAIYPFGFTGLWWWKSVMSATSFRVTDTQWWYVPVHALTETPVMLLVCWVTGVGLAVWYAVRFRRMDPAGTASISVVATQALLLPLLAIAAESQFYNGLRQVMFVMPASAVLTTVGIAWLMRRLAILGSRVPVLATVVSALVLIPVTVEQAALFPFQYSWSNRIASVLNVPPDPDYWRVSFRQLIDESPTDGRVYCSPRTPEGVARPTGRAFSSGDCRTLVTGPLMPYWPTPLVDDLPEEQFYGFVQGSQSIPSNCVELGSVSRSWLGRTFTYSHVAVCTDVGPSTSVG